MSKQEISERIKKIALLKYTEDGYTIKKEDDKYYRMWNKQHKLYLVFYVEKWCIGEIDKYTSQARWCVMPTPVINKFNEHEMNELLNE
jgi:hypothetical protein